LEGNSDPATVLSHRRATFWRSSSGDSPQKDGRFDHRPGFSAMNRVEPFFGGYFVDLGLAATHLGSVFLEQIVHLTPDHAPDTGGPSKDLAAFDQSPWGQGATEDRLEGHRLEGIAGQNRSGFVELTMASGPSSPQVVIIHRGQIVMDQRVAVDHFQSAGVSHGRFEISTQGFAG
jgi:hypothetical protein